MLLRLKSLFCLLQSFLLLVSSFSVYDSAFKKFVDRAAMAMTGITDFTFDPLTGAAVKVTAAEKQRCRKWFDANIRTAASPAYDFTVGGKDFRRHIADWEITVGEESEAGEKYRGGKTTVVALRHKKSGLSAAVEATIYEEYAACEWTVFLTNGGNANTPAVKDFYAIHPDYGTAADLKRSKTFTPRTALWRRGGPTCISARAATRRRMTSS